jgi:uncharacterized protein (DUF488 family)
MRDAIHNQRTGKVLTIGYEGRSLEEYLDKLSVAGTTMLCDVRRNAISRKRGFSKKSLARGCEGVGIQYRHLPELGIASERRRKLNTQSDYDRLFEEYARETLPLKREAKQQLGRWVREGERVALTCFERSPHQCHRHCVAEALEREFGPDFTAEHL